MLLSAKASQSRPVFWPLQNCQCRAACWLDKHAPLVRESYASRRGLLVSDDDWHDLQQLPHHCQAGRCLIPADGSGWHATDMFSD